MSHSIIIKFSNGAEMQVTECAYLSDVPVVPESQQAWVEFNPIVKVKDMVFDPVKSTQNLLHTDFGFTSVPARPTPQHSTVQFDTLTPPSFNPYANKTGLTTGDLSVKSKRALHRSAMTNFLSTISGDE